MLLPKQEQMAYLGVPSVEAYSASVTGSDLTDDDDFLMDDLTNDGQGEDGQPKKKRVRHNLSHLTMEERINRRKMKNRIAAQTARDRKKAKMDVMEIKVAKLAEERLKLVRENERLKKLAEQVSKENTELKKRLQSTKNPVEGLNHGSRRLSEGSNCSNPSSTVSGMSNCGPFEPAALISAPLPQEQESQQDKLDRMNLVPGTMGSRSRSTVNQSRATMENLRKNLVRKSMENPSNPLMMQFVFWFMTIANLMTSSNGSKSVLRTFLVDNSKKMPREMVTRLELFLSKDPRSTRLSQPDQRSYLKSWQKVPS